MSRRRAAVARRAGVTSAPKPYRGAIDPLAAPLNASSALSIPTSSGHGAMHPDVLDMGSSWNGLGRYWMAFTPYNGDQQNEIPSVVTASSIASGGTWAVPSGYTNPLAPDPAGTSHHADTDVIYDATTDRIYVFYITGDNATFQDIRCRYTTGDGTWSSEITVIAGASLTHGNVSVVKTASGWRMYYDANGLAVYYVETTSAPHTGWGSPVAVTFPTIDDQFRRVQNINMVKDTDGSYVAIISDSNFTTLNGLLWFARSEDDGVTFRYTGSISVMAAGGASAWDSGGIYRASLMTTSDGTVVVDGDNLHLWYSGYSPSVTVWGTGYVQIPHDVIKKTYAPAPEDQDSVYEAAVLEDSPVVYHRLNDASGTTVADGRGTGRTSTYISAPTLRQRGATPDGDKSVLFNGSGQYISTSVGGTLDTAIKAMHGGGAGDFTLECLVKPNALDSSRGLFDRYGNGASTTSVYLLYLVSGVPRFIIRNASNADVTLIGSEALPINKWSHLVARLSGTTMTIWVNGVQQGSTTTTLPATMHGRTPALFMGLFVFSSISVSGWMDELAVYDHALSDARIAAHVAAL